MHNVHGTTGGSTSVCIIDGEIISGSDNGTLVRMDLFTMKSSVISTVCTLSWLFTALVDLGSEFRQEHCSLWSS